MAGELVVEMEEEEKKDFIWEIFAYIEGRYYKSLSFRTDHTDPDKAINDAFNSKIETGLDILSEIPITDKSKVLLSDRQNQIWEYETDFSYKLKRIS